MRNTKLIITICLITTVYCFCLTSQETATETEGKTSLKKLFDPNKKVQTLLKSFIDKDGKGFVPRSKEAWNNKLSKLRKSIEGGQKKLVSELLYFLISAQGMREAMLPGVIIDKIELSRIDLLKGLIPYIDVDHKTVRDHVKNLLKAVEDNDENSQTPDFKPYELFLREKKSDIPLSLVQYMYRRHASKSLKIMVKIYNDKLNAKQLAEIREAHKRIRAAMKKIKQFNIQKSNLSSEDQDKIEKVKKKIEFKTATLRSYLKQMASSRFWWVRLYAAEILRSKPEYKNDIIIKNLISDKNELVRKTIHLIKEKADSN